MTLHIQIHASCVPTTITAYFVTDGYFIVMPTHTLLVPISVCVTLAVGAF